LRSCQREIGHSVSLIVENFNQCILIYEKSDLTNFANLIKYNLESIRRRTLCHSFPKILFLCAYIYVYIKILICT